MPPSAHGEDTVVACLNRLGFVAGRNEHPATQLVIGRTYLPKDLVELFGGQLQAGIWTLREFAVVFIFSGDSGKTYGYSDGWTESGIFRYTGEGQHGDMTFTAGNKATLVPQVFFLEGKTVMILGHYHVTKTDRNFLRCCIDEDGCRQRYGR